MLAIGYNVGDTDTAALVTVDYTSASTSVIIWDLFFITFNKLKNDES